MPVNKAQRAHLRIYAYEGMRRVNDKDAEWNISYIQLSCVRHVFLFFDATTPTRLVMSTSVPGITTRMCTNSPKWDVSLLGFSERENIVRRHRSFMYIYPKRNTKPVVDDSNVKIWNRVVIRSTRRRVRVANVENFSKTLRDDLSGRNSDSCVTSWNGMTDYERDDGRRGDISPESEGGYRFRKK